MQSHTEQKTEISPFDMICDAARSNNPVLLNDALEVVCIDVWQESDYGTPVTRLAYLGEVDAVKFLLARGASPANAACGYARGGHMKKLYELLSQVETQTPNKLTAVLKQATYGVALSQAAKKIDAFWEKITKEYPDQIKLLYGSLAKAHAQKGNMSEADRLWRSKRYQSVEMGTQIISGLALGGHVEKINSLNNFGAGKDTSIETSYQHAAVIYLARGGHKDKIKLLKHTFSYSPDRLIMKSLAQNGIDENTEIHEDIKALGFAAGGYRKKAFEYAGKNPKSQSEIASEFISNGHLDTTLDFLKTYPDQSNIDAVANELCSMKNTDDANIFLEKMKKDQGITSEQVTQFIKASVSLYYSQNRPWEAVRFFEKQPTEEVLSKMLNGFKTSEKAIECQKIILLRHAIFSETILKHHLLTCRLNRVNPHLSLLLVAVLANKTLSAIPATPSDPLIPLSLEEELKKSLSEYNLKTLTPMIQNAEEDQARLGFTTMRQLIAWRDPAIQYVLLNFQKIMIPALIEHVISFLCVAPVSRIAKGRTFFFEKMKKPTPKISNIATVHAPQESKTILSGVSKKAGEQKAEISPFDMICDAARSNNPALYVHITAESESKITASGITQQELIDILDTYKAAHIFGRKSNEIKALYHLAYNPQFKDVLIHHSVIKNILSPYPERKKLFTDSAAKITQTDTDRVILEIRALYQSKKFDKKPPQKPGPKNGKR